MRRPLRAFAAFCLGYCFAVSGCRPAETPGEDKRAVESVTPAPAPAPAPSPPMLVDVRRNPLELEQKAVNVVAGKEVSVRARTGVITSVVTRTSALQVAFEKDNVRIAAGPNAPGGEFVVIVKGVEGPDVRLRVYIESRPVETLHSFALFETDFSLTEGKEETRLNQVTSGWALEAWTEDPKSPLDATTRRRKAAPGLTAVVDNTAVRASPASGGSGYQVDDVLTATEEQGKPALLTVTRVDNGAIKALTVTEPGDYAIRPPRAPIATKTTGGSGNGAIMKLTNAVKIQAGKELKTGTYTVFIDGVGKTKCHVTVHVNRPAVSVVQPIIPLGTALAGGSRLNN